MSKTTQALQEYIRYSKYAKYIDAESRRETWAEQIDRVMRTHNKKYSKELTASPELVKLFAETKNSYLNNEFLGSQRILQFAGDVNNPDAACPILKHQARVFNCVTTPLDRVEAFSEIMYFLMCGCGVGFSIIYENIHSLPTIQPLNDETKEFIVEDSVEGWADAFGVLMESYFRVGKFPEYWGKRIEFNFSQIRPEGAYITGGFRAPGFDGLDKSLKKIKQLIEARLSSTSFTTDEFAYKLRPINAYDIIMHESDAVLSGGK